MTFCLDYDYACNTENSINAIKSINKEHIAVIISTVRCHGLDVYKANIVRHFCALFTSFYK